MNIFRQALFLSKQKSDKMDYSGGNVNKKVAIKPNLIDYFAAIRII
jgi:hypothetical protein